MMVGISYDECDMAVQLLFFGVGYTNGSHVREPNRIQTCSPCRRPIEYVNSICCFKVVLRFPDQHV